MTLSKEDAYFMDGIAASATHLERAALERIHSPQCAEQIRWAAGVLRRYCNLSMWIDGAPPPLREYRERRSRQTEAVDAVTVPGPVTP